MLQTDGLSDNVFSDEMATICLLASRAGGSEDVRVQAIADRMVDYARLCMESKDRVSPFESMLKLSINSIPDPNTQETQLDKACFSEAEYV